MLGEEHSQLGAPLYGIGGLLGVTLMLLLLVAVPAVRWFALFSVPLGIIMAAGIRAGHHVIDRRSRRIIWTRDLRHFHWPVPSDNL